MARADSSRTLAHARSHLNERAVRIERLRAHAARPPLDVRQRELGYVPLQSRYLRGQVDGAPHLVNAERKVLPRERAEALEGERVPHVPEPERPHSVSLAREREHGVGSEPHLTVGPRCEVHAEERVARIGHWVDVAFDEVALALVKEEVITSEGDDSWLGVAAALGGEPVGVQAAAHHHAIRHDALPARCANYHGGERRRLALCAPPAEVATALSALEVDDLAAEQNLPAGLLKVGAVRACHAGPVDHSGRRAAHRHHARAVWLDGADLLGCLQLRARPDRAHARSGIAEHGPRRVSTKLLSQVQQGAANRAGCGHAQGTRARSMSWFSTRALARPSF